MTDTRPSEQRTQPRTTRFVHAWRASAIDGPPLCGTPVPYRGPRPLVQPYEVCVVCAALAQNILRKDAA